MSVINFADTLLNDFVYSVCKEIKNGKSTRTIYEYNKKKIWIMKSVPRLPQLEKNKLKEIDSIVFCLSEKDEGIYCVQNREQINRCYSEFTNNKDNYDESNTDEYNAGDGRKKFIKNNSTLTGNIKELGKHLNNEWGADIKMDNDSSNNGKSIEEQLKDLISNGATQIILTGAPGIGKTRMAKEVAEKLNGKGYEFVQFHPSYDYTDFVEGLRPIEDKDNAGNTTMVFRKVDGIFKKFCREVVKQNAEEKKYFFLIDEINRADLSKVFGELMFCLETDKRGKGNAVQTQYQNLPTYDVKEKKYYGENEDIFANGFYIPENVIIIGTMNDIDRSVESMDFALRRRFIWKEVEVTRDLLKNSLTGILGEYKEKYKCNFECDKVAEVIADSIMNLNNEKLKDNPNFGKHYFISQGQFANLPGNIINQAIDAGEKAEDKTEAIAKSLISSVWDLRLESLLYEYIRGEGDEQDFVEECKKALESREEKESTQA
ncbi:McrB family protein [Blautia sp.]